MIVGRHAPVVLFFAAMLSGCAQISLSSEAKDLNDATTPLVDGLKKLDPELKAARHATAKATFLQDLFAGVPTARYNITCETNAIGVFSSITNGFSIVPYDAIQQDKSFLSLVSIVPCDIDAAAVGHLSLAKAPLAGADPDVQTPVGGTSLENVAKGLEGYVKALSELASGEASKKETDARKKAFEAAGSFLAALSVPFAGPIAGIANNLANSAATARRQESLLKVISTVDPILPSYMERIGLAGRVAAASALQDRVRASQTLAVVANQIFAASPGTGSAAMAQRVQVALAFDDRIGAENGSILALRVSDPMRPARAFAVAHRALKDILADPKAKTQAFAEGLTALQQSAAELDKAIKDAEAAKQKKDGT